MNSRQKAKITARLLRRKATPAEEKFWEVAKNRNLFGKKILRQHPIWFVHNDRERFFIADFYCAEAKLVIEIDGGIHEKQAEYDSLRSLILNYRGIRVVRVKNEELENPPVLIDNLSTYLME
jgi:very-short-patch-repair endonuclease